MKPFMSRWACGGITCPAPLNRSDAPWHPPWALACPDSMELRRVAAALTAAGINNTGIKVDPTLNKEYVAFKDPDGIAWEFYMV